PVEPPAPPDGARGSALDLGSDRDAAHVLPVFPGSSLHGRRVATASRGSFPGDAVPRGGGRAAARRDALAGAAAPACLRIGAWRDARAAGAVGGLGPGRPR